MWYTILDTFGTPASVSCGKVRTARLTRFSGLCLMCGLCVLGSLQAQDPEGVRGGGFGGRGGGGRRGGFDPAEMVSRMDQDQNGIITANEVERLPAFIRDRWQQQGLDFNRGVPIQELQQNAQRGMEEMRRQREEGGGEGSGQRRDFERADRPEFNPPADMGRGSGQPNNAPGSPSPAAGGLPPGAPRNRISPLLQDSFRSIDLDTDGQIALYEWRKAKRGPLSQFAQQDLDGDGFLTPKELSKVVASPTATPNAPGTPAANATSTAAATPAPASPPPAPVPVSAEAAVKAARAFDLLDKNKNGTIDSEEWAASSRLKPLFEKGGFDLSKPLNKDNFTQGFARVGG